MALTLLRCQQFLIQNTRRPLQDHVRQLTSIPKRNVVNFNLNTNPEKRQLLAIPTSSYQLARNVSFGSSFKGNSFPKAFLLGFAAMIVFMMSESVVKKYRQSGFSFKDIISRKISNPVEESDELLTSKYATILSAKDTPDLKPSRIVPGKVKLPNMKLKLLQYQTCPFCCKVRAFLDYYGLPYEIVEVNPVMRQQLKFSKTYRKVPILLISMENQKDSETLNDCKDSAEKTTLQINDSTLIISTLTSYLLSQRPKSKHRNEDLPTLTRWYLTSKIYSNEEEEKVGTESDGIFRAKAASEELVNRYFLMIGDIDPKKYDRMDPPLAEERRWRRWVDEQFVHVLSPNIYRTFDEALKSFNYFSEVGEWEKNFANWERIMVINVGALAMYYVSKRLKKKYGLKDNVRLSLYDECNYWLKSIGPNRRFMGGATPNLADLAVYGALSSIEGCEAFSDLMQNTKMSRWYFDVKRMVEQHEGTQKITLPF